MARPGRLLRMAAVAGAALLVLAIPAVAHAAPRPWSASHGVGKAVGTWDTAPTGQPFTYRLTVVGTLTVSANDGKCYYVRLYRHADLLGQGVNSERQCGAGWARVQFDVQYQVPFTRGVDVRVCRANPGTPDEWPMSPGTDCGTPFALR